MRWNAGDWKSVPSSATDLHGDLRQVISPFCAICNGVGWRRRRGGNNSNLLCEEYKMER